MMQKPERGILRPHPLVAVVAFLAVGVLLSCASAYGYSGDELVYLACARRLAWGYVGVPPLSIAVLAVASRLYGETILSVRLVPALALAMTVVLTARLARRFGAGPYAQALAGLSVVASPALLANAHTFTPASLTVLLWVATAGLFARTVDDDAGKGLLPWVRAGVMLGFALTNDVATVPFAVALFVGLALTKERRWLKTSGPWVALGAACLVAMPYVAWERANGWPIVTVLASRWRQTEGGDGHGAFLAGQLGWMLPANALVWGAGLAGLLRSPRLASCRFLGVAFLTLLAGFVVAGHVPPTALAPAYPMLFAAGAFFLEDRAKARAWTWLLPSVAGLVAVMGAVAAPIAIPLLRVARYEAYARTLHLGGGEASPLPRRFASNYGWPELARTVASVTDSLAPEDREEAVVLASNAYEAGALDRFGAAVGLPPVLAGEGPFGLWGAHGYTGSVVVAVGGDETLLRSLFRSVKTVAVYDHSLALPSEQDVKIHLCRDPTAPLDVLWPRLKVYD